MMQTAKDIFEATNIISAEILVVNGKVIFIGVKKCVESLLLFPSIYYYEPGFSTMCTMKNKLATRFSIKHDLQVCPYKTLSRIDLLVKQIQAHPLHKIYDEMILLLLAFPFNQG